MEAFAISLTSIKFVQFNITDAKYPASAEKLKLEITEYP